MKKIITALVASAVMSMTAAAQTTFHTDLMSFEEASQNLVLTTFVNSNLTSIAGGFSIAGADNSQIATFTTSNGAINFNVGNGVPTAGTPIVGAANTAFTFTLTPGVTAFGIDVLDLGDEGGNARTPVTFSATTSSGATFDFRTDFVAPNANTFFAGITSSDTISSVTFNNSRREFVGFANLRTGVSAVPEPATWLMMILGFAGVGLMLKRRQRAYMHG